MTRPIPSCSAARIFRFWRAAIRQTVGDGVAIVDFAETTAEAVAEAISLIGIEGDGEAALRFFATDSPERFARVGATFLGRPIAEAEVELVDLRFTT